MKKFATICAIVTALAFGGCELPPATDISDNDPTHVPTRTQRRSKHKPGNYQMNIESYSPRRGARIRESDLGTRVGREPGTFENGQTGYIDFYDYGTDGYPDMIVVRTQNGQIVSIGFDSKSKNYSKMKKRLKGKIERFYN